MDKEPKTHHAAMKEIEMTKTETTKTYRVYLIEGNTQTPVSVSMSDEAARAELDRIKGEWYITRHLGESRWYEVRPAK